MELKNIFSEGELEEASVCRDFRHTGSDGKAYQTKFYNLDAMISVGYRVNSKLQDGGKISANIAQEHAHSEFEKYRIVQDRLFESYFDKIMKNGELGIKNSEVRMKNSV